MGSSTAVATKWSHVELAAGAACLILVCVAASGCVLGNDNDSPVLAVDPLWDLSPGSRFTPGSCEAAGVYRMTWEIQDGSGRTLTKSAGEEDERCRPLDFLDLRPGTYTLVIAGYDRADEERWTATCKGLELGRFDILHTCKVEEIEDGTPPPSDEDEEDEDAGSD